MVGWTQGFAGSRREVEGSDEVAAWVEAIKQTNTDKNQQQQQQKV